jgi:hypothetical protein
MLNEVRMAQELLRPFCVLRTSSFSVRFGSSVGITLWSAGSAPQAAVEISPNDSGSFRGLSFISLVAGMARSGKFWPRTRQRQRGRPLSDLLHAD